MSEVSNTRTGIRLLFAAIGVIIALAVIGAVRVVVQKPPSEKRTVFDTQFISKANHICEKQLRPLEHGRPDKDATLSVDETAKRVDDSANALTVMTNQLRGVAVRTSEQASVTSWLSRWDSYIATGHRYANELRAGDRNQWSKTGQESADLNEKLYSFSTANHLDSCVIQSSIDTSNSGAF